MLSLPGFESVFPLFCTPRLREAGDRVARWLERAGVRSTPARQEIWRSYASLADAESRRAFFRMLREVVDFRGQAVSALGRLHRAAKLPTLIIWGARDPFIPVRHAFEAHDRGNLAAGLRFRFDATCEMIESVGEHLVDSEPGSACGAHARRIRAEGSFDPPGR